MTRTKFWSSFLAISVVLIASFLAVSPIAIADDVDDDDGEDEELLFRWNPDDAFDDNGNFIVITGSLTRIGFFSDITRDVQGEVEGLLKGDSENNSEKIVSTTGPPTITTTIKAKSQDADDLEGVIQIGGNAFETKLTVLDSEATSLEVIDEISGPSGTQTATQERLTIPVTIEMCDDNDKCFDGFGVIRRESSITEFGGVTLSFSTDTLEAELIDDSGLFQLNLLRIQRTVT